MVLRIVMTRYFDEYADCPGIRLFVYEIILILIKESGLKTIS
jgi:hypothetical protein